MAMCKRAGLAGLTTSNSWMFLSSFENLRNKLISEATIDSLVQLSVHGFHGIAAQVCTFVIRNSHTDGYLGGYVRLNAFDHWSLQEGKTLEAIQNPDCGWFYRRNADTFKQIPGTPIAYWASPEFLLAFAAAPSLCSVAEARQGFTTGNNSLLLRLWFEISMGDSSLSCSLKPKWYPCDKGGDFRKWYGNNDFFCDWEDDGARLAAFPGSTLRNRQYYLKPSFWWSDVSSAHIASRFKPAGFVFEHCSDSVFGDLGLIRHLGSFLNSSTAAYFLSFLSPSMKFEVGQIRKLPVVKAVLDDAAIDERVIALIKESKADYDSFETSWDFKCHPLL